MVERTQVGIIGAGPAGLLLSQLLHLQGIDTIVVERRSPQYVLSRIRAGALEPKTISLLKAAQIGDRIDKVSQQHSGFDICFGEERFHINLEELTNGRVLTIYGQTDITRDLMEARKKLDGKIIYEVDETSIHDLDTDSPSIRYIKDEAEHEIQCDYVVGCDGFHGVSRPTIPSDTLRTHERIYPFNWIAILTDSRPIGEDVIYVNSDRGFVLCSMRSDTRSRYGIQTDINETIEDWPDERIWEELGRRLSSSIADNIDTGPVLDKGIVTLRSFIAEPMRHQRLFLAGDAAHIFPPTGAKGLNIAVSDVFFLSRALVDFYGSGNTTLLDEYSDTALERVWAGEAVSADLTALLHQYPESDSFSRGLQITALKTCQNPVPPRLLWQSVMSGNLF